METTGGNETIGRELTREEAAERRIVYALERLQEAQNNLGNAAAAVSGVIGMVRDHDRLTKLYNQIRREWYALEAMLRKNQIASKEGRKVLQLASDPQSRYELEYAPRAEVERRIDESLDGAGKVPR